VPENHKQFPKAYQWNANDYSQNSSAQFEWAQELIPKLNLKGDETLLDIGCGDGRITAMLAERLPYGSVLGIDNSSAMIKLAQQNHPPFHYSNLAFQKLDVRDLVFENQFDVIFSNAALHWVPGHFSLLKRIKKALKKSGKILLQMGGKGNADEMVSVVHDLIKMEKWRSYFPDDLAFPYFFHSDEEYREWLKDAGFDAVRVELVSKDMQQKGEQGIAGWLRTTWHPYTERVPSDLVKEFIAEIIQSYEKSHPTDKAGFFHIRMVRLEVEAISTN